MQRVFGSEELSARSAPILERTALPRLAIAPADAERLDLLDGAQAELVLDGDLHRLPIRIDPAITEGTASIPLGSAGLTGLRLPAWGEIRVPAVWQRDLTQ
jgi:NADH-quinone oxidoreductase subunit G